MSYEITELLLKAEKQDFEFFIANIDSTINFTSDKKLNNLLARFNRSNSIRDKEDLAKGIEEEIRYLGSADVSYLFRSIFSDGPAGVSINEMIDDVSDKLKIRGRSNKHESVENNLIYLVEVFSEEKLSHLSREEQEHLFTKLEVDEDKRNEFFNAFATDTSSSILGPILSVVGGLGVQALISALVLDSLVSIAGASVVSLVATRAGSSLLGPIGIALGIGWAGYDLQGPAFRKTVPIILYLGLIALRNNEKYLTLK